MFEIGDFVRYKSGSATYVVEGFNFREEVKIVHTETQNFYWVPSYRLMKLETEKKEEKMKLYEFEVDGVKLYGTKLAVNSAGQWVMEVKGSSTIYAVAPSAVEEVIPHSIGVVFLNNDKVYSFLAPKDKYQVGQTFLLETKHGTSVVVVKEVDTKSSYATAEFQPLVELVTKPIDK